MIIKKITLENYTVFENQQIEFSPGINVIIGENGTGKTHILKVLYSACQSVDKKVSFSQKLVSTMLPDDYKISRLITRKPEIRTAMIRITAGRTEDPGNRVLKAVFHENTKKWKAEVTGEEGWEDSFADISSVFIPAKEILSHSYNLNAAAQRNNIRFDDTYLDIVNAAKVDISSGLNSDSKTAILKKIQEIIHGTVFYDANRDEFYLKNKDDKQEFNLVAEGFRKLALLWQLIKNGTLEKGSLLFWDEPENNMSPTYISCIVEIILELQRQGVQIFISTHDYMFARCLELKKQERDRSVFHLLSRSDNEDIVYHNQSEAFEDLKVMPTFVDILNR